MASSDHLATLWPMLTGALRSNVDRVWDAFWSVGISNPMGIIEQVTYLIIIRRLDAPIAGTPLSGQHR